ncbi:P-selectin glycoprotein ligand 1 isoform X1 [Electrophorus electricus]|uniref:P-selectin glycoprotein ligand 1 isoform X1 n=1 Tax=Electrophorus electricus TaxID=8005 RepID=UPI000F0A9678|nr:P-selectin glycoprotein ligand 1 isoform X1 [Electrophorus electricus]
MTMTTNRPELRQLLLLLLSTSSLVSSRRLLTVGEGSQNRITTQQQGIGATPHTGPEILFSEALSQTLPTARLNEQALDGGRTTVQHASEVVTSQHPKRSETSGIPHLGTGNERHISEHLPAGTEHPAYSKSYLHSQLPVSNPASALPPGSSTPTLPVRNSSSVSPQGTSVLTASVPATPKKMTPNHATHSAVNVPTMHKTNGSFLPRTTGQQVHDWNKTTSMRSTQTQATPTTSRDKDHVCSTATQKRDSLAGRCLIAIAVLAGLATTFIVITIVLATKLAGRKYRHQPHVLEDLDTEMLCISRVVSGGFGGGGSDMDRPVPKPRRPRNNGVLIPTTDDEDGDDLTLNSFLPDTECAA